MAENILTYVLNLQDNISDKLKRIGINNEQQLDTWARVQKQVNGASQTMQNMGRSIGSMNERISALRAQREWIPASNREAIRATNHEIQRLEREIQKLESLDGGLMKKWFNDIKAGIPALVNPLSAAMVGLGKSISLGMEEQLQRQNITTLMGGDTAGADALFNKIAEYGKNTVYDKAGLIEAQKTMMSFGLEGEQAFGMLKRIGDVAMGDKQKMQSLALAFSQATSAGKLQGQDLMQMINAGFNPLNEISKHTGKSMAQLKDEMAKGKITADDLAKAFQWATEEGGLFYNGAEKAGQTFAGKLGQMKDALAELGVKVFNTLEPVLSWAVNFAAGCINVLGNVAGWLVRGFKTVVGWADRFRIVSIPLGAALLALVAVLKASAVAAKLKAMWDGICAGATALWTKIQVGFNLALLACPITWIVVGIVALIAAIYVCCTKITGWGSLWKGIVGFMKNSFIGFVDSVKLYFTTLVNGIMIGLDNIKLGWYKFKEAAGLGDSSENQAAIAKINKDIDDRKKAIADGAKKVQQDLSAAKDSLGGIEMGWKKSDKASDKVKSGGVGEQLMAMAGGGGTGGGVTSGSTGATDASTKSVATGGSRSTNITINLKSLVEKIVFEGGVAENGKAMADQVAKYMLQALNMAQASVG